MKKIFSLVIMATLTSFSIMGCKSSEDGNVVNISILNSKPEISLTIESFIKEFEDKNEDIRIQTINIIRLILIEIN